MIRDKIPLYRFKSPLIRFDSLKSSLWISVCLIIVPFIELFQTQRFNVVGFIGEGDSGTMQTSEFEFGFCFLNLMNCLDSTCDWSRQLAIHLLHLHHLQSASNLLFFDLVTVREQSPIPQLFSVIIFSFFQFPFRSVFAVLPCCSHRWSSHIPLVLSDVFFVPRCMGNPLMHDMTAR